MPDTDQSAREPEAMVDEFNLLPLWIGDAVRALGADHALPATCRDCGGPGALDWLLDRLDIGQGERLLDVGAGMGGPAAYAARTRGVVPLLTDPMPGACREARDLFLLTATESDGASLPWDDDAFDHAWSLGVLCTVADKRALLDEVARVLAPGGSLGLLVYERTGQPTATPDGNHFPTHEQTTRLLHDTGFTVVAEAALGDVPRIPAEWRRAAARVDGWIRERHDSEPAWQRAQEQKAILSTLFERAEVVGRLLLAHAAIA